MGVGRVAVEEAHLSPLGYFLGGCSVKRSTVARGELTGTCQPIQDESLRGSFCRLQISRIFKPNIAFSGDSRAHSLPRDVFPPRTRHARMVTTPVIAALEWCEENLPNAEMVLHDKTIFVFRRLLLSFSFPRGCSWQHNVGSLVDMA